LVTIGILALDDLEKEALDQDKNLMGFFFAI
jgi:hypothetical protein